MPESITVLKPPHELALAETKLLAEGNIPSIFSEAARGKFPMLEQGLNMREKKWAIPPDWTVENVLSAVSVGYSTVRRLENNLPPDHPKEVRLILGAGNYSISEKTGDFGYDAVDFEVAYHDNSVSYGHVRMPGFYRDDTLAGLPWADPQRDNGGDSNQENAPVMTGAYDFTPLGTQLVSFLAGTIASYDRFFHGTDADE